MLYMSPRREKIVQRRKTASLTQQEVADVLGVTSRTVQRWELGDSIPVLNPLQFWRLCNLYGCTAEDLAMDFYPEAFGDGESGSSR